MTNAANITMMLDAITHSTIVATASASLRTRTLPVAATLRADGAVMAIG
jgi:hypothetical protein